MGDVKFLVQPHLILDEYFDARCLVINSLVSAARQRNSLQSSITVGKMEEGGEEVGTANTSQLQKGTTQASDKSTFDSDTGSMHAAPSSKRLSFDSINIIYCL